MITIWFWFLRLFAYALRPAPRLPGTPKRILVGAIGKTQDGIGALPLISELRNRHPDATIALLVNRSTTPLYSTYPGLDATLPARGRLGKKWFSPDPTTIDLIDSFQPDWWITTTAHCAHLTDAHTTAWRAGATFERISGEHSSGWLDRAITPGKSWRFLFEPTIDFDSGRVPRLFVSGDELEAVYSNWQEPADRRVALLTGDQWNRYRVVLRAVLLQLNNSHYHPLLVVPEVDRKRVYSDLQTDPELQEFPEESIIGCDDLRRLLAISQSATVVIAASDMVAAIACASGAKVARWGTGEPFWETDRSSLLPWTNETKRDSTAVIEFIHQYIPPIIEQSSEENPTVDQTEVVQCVIDS